MTPDAEPYRVSAGLRRVDGWSQHRLPFQPQGVDLAFRAELQAQLGVLAESGVGELRGTFTSEDGSHVDVENVLLYNVGGRALGSLTRRGLQLERVRGAPVPPSLDGPRRYHHAYEEGASAVGAPLQWSAIKEGDVVAAFRSLPLSAAALPSAVAPLWWALRHGDHEVGSETLGDFILDIHLQGPQPIAAAGVVKRVVDAVVASLQRETGEPDPATVGRLAAWCKAPGEEVVVALTDGRASLGGRHQLVRSTAHGVAWNPSDERCLGLHITMSQADHWVIEGRVTAASSRPSPYDRIRGCLLGGAVGDGLGEPVEFMTLADIHSRFGDAGVTGPADFGSTIYISDDTQMTLFTAEGLMRWDNRFEDKGIGTPTALMGVAYQRWLATQGGPAHDPFVMSGWLVGQNVLWQQRAPGSTCLSALRGGHLGSVDRPVNDSKGCGGVMRVAPCAFSRSIRDPFTAGCEFAALTHGHRSGYLAAGCFAQIIADVDAGATLRAAVVHALSILIEHPSHEEVFRSVERALELAGGSAPTAAAVESLGAGWVAEEALAISLYCSLTATDFASGVRLAVNHGGDSDSTGSMTGQVLGTLLGVGAIPNPWIEALEAREVVEAVADDLARHAIIRLRGDLDKYPDG